MAHIMLIDDQHFYGELLTADLADEGYRLTHVEDPDLALSEIERQNPDIILLDLYFQGFEGWEILGKIKALDNAPPVIILSAYDSFKDDPRLSESDGYVVKDIYTDTLVGEVGKVLNRGYPAM
jgi:DNA-binding response OmpR family regulator